MNLLMILMEAQQLKKLPKYMSQTLTSLFMKSPYGTFVNDFPSQTKKMEALLEKEARFFDSVSILILVAVMGLLLISALQDKNLGLIRIAFSCAKRWSLKKLTETYVSLSLSEIAAAVGLSDPAEVRQLVLDMVGASGPNSENRLFLIFPITDPEQGNLWCNFWRR